MPRRLAYNVVKRNPGTGAVEVFEAGTVPPGWAAEMITNDEVWEREPQASEVDGGGAGDGAAPGPTDPPAVAPPRHGVGSGRDPWAAYATSLGIQVPDDAGRNDIIVLVEAIQP